MSKLIGLSGYGGAGKDEVGRILVEDHGFVRFAKGDLIKDAAWGIDPLIETPANPMRVHTLNKYGKPLEAWDLAKEISDDARAFLQNLADEVVRVCGRDVWNDRLYELINEYQKTHTQGVVMTRLSLPIEAETCKANGGEVWRIERPGYGPANDHPNEVALDGWDFDFTIINGGNLKTLASSVACILGSVPVPSPSR